MPYELSEIKKIRKNLGLTQTQLSKRANVSQSLIAKIESGKIDPTFTKTKKIFEHIKGLNLSNVQMKYLSMGMSNSYRVALEEGANIVRIGSKLFGKRAYRATVTPPDR